MVLSEELLLAAYAGTDEHHHGDRHCQKDLLQVHFPYFPFSSWLLGGV
jgi:hypothetical protein